MDDHDEYEFTAPLDDTVALDRPTAESRLLNLDLNTEVLDVCESPQCSGDQVEDYCEKEIVLDSDDEGGNQNEDVNSVNGCFSVNRRPSGSGRDAIGLLRRQKFPAGYFQRLDNKVRERVFHHFDSARSERSNGESTAGRICIYDDARLQEHHVVVDSVVSRSRDPKPLPMNPVEPDNLYLVRESSTEESLDERKLSSHEIYSVDMRKDMNHDSKLAELKYVESPCAAESQDKAIRFVDHYLSASDWGSYKDIQTRKIDKIKSPPSMRSKGSQSLARRVNLGSTDSKLRTFEWAEEQIEKDEYTSLRTNEDSIFGFEDNKTSCLSVNQESDNVNLHNKIVSLQSKEKLPGNLLSPNDLGTDSLNSSVTEKMGSNTITRIAYDSMELDKLLDAGLSRWNVEKDEQFSRIPDALDIGMGTQVAAEAMEELMHAVPSKFDACFTYQGSDNKLSDFPNAVNNKSQSKHIANHEETFVGWRCKEKRSKCMKTSTVQGKTISRSGAKRYKKQRKSVVPSLVTKNLMTEKLTNGELLKSKNARNTRNRKCGVSPGITVQQVEYGFPEQYSSKNGIKSDSPSERRNMIRFLEDVEKIGVKGACLKSNFNFEVKIDTAEGEENCNLDVAGSTSPKLNLWVYPKRKRSRHIMPHHTISSRNHFSPSAANKNNVEKYPIVNDEALDTVPKLLVYNRRRKFPMGRENIGSPSKLAVDLSSSFNDSAVSDREVQASIVSDTDKPLMQSGVLDDREHPSISASTNIKSDSLSSRHSMTLEVLEGSDKRKEPFKPLTRSHLMKELIRLGYTESLPDVLPKESRRRRAMEKICILFSQNLETSIIKQQKKIVARLGFAIASCCSDATHFVTDRFVRTRNMLEAIALGKPVVTHLWLESCEHAGYVVDEKSYLLRDEKKEKEIGFNMPVSLSRARKLPLLKGRRVLITPNVKPGIDVINSLLKAVQGQVVQNILTAKMRHELIPDDLLIISCEEDYSICLQFLETGASIYDSELLLNGIVTQKLEYERYRLFKDFENGQSCLP